MYAVADALVEPEWRDRGLLDTAVVTVRFDNGAVGVAEACFEAAYGYDVRGEVFGSAGMATMGDGRVGPAWSSPDAAGRVVEHRPERPSTAGGRLRRGAGRLRRRRPRTGARCPSAGRTPEPRWASPWPRPSRCASAGRCSSSEVDA